MSKRIRLDTDARRQQLLETGLRRFGDRPYGDVSMDEIARAAGVSHGLLYHYFPSKRDFYSEILRHIGERLAAIADPDPALPPLDQLRAGLAAHVGFAADFPDAYRTLVLGGNGSDPKLARLVEAARWRALRPIMAALGIGEPEPRVRIALRGWSSFNDGAVLEWLQRPNLKPDELIELMAQALVGVLRAAGMQDTVERILTDRQ